MRLDEEELEAISEAISQTLDRLKPLLLGEMISAAARGIERYRIKKALLGDRKTGE